LANTYHVGDLVRITGTFENSAGTDIDPSVVRAQYKDPSGAIISLQYGVDAELVKSATGVYYVDIDADAAGIWYFRMYSTGTGQGANESYFLVAESEFA
jgi:hypothetical protein